MSTPATQSPTLPAGPTLPADTIRWLRAPVPPNAEFGVYVHVPFCAHICPYCDFNTYAGLSDLIPRYVAAIEQDMALQSPGFAGRRATSLFLGGGTPSQLTTAQVGQIISAARATFDLTPDAEISIETNPNDLSEEYCVGLREAGINRLSIGAQTLDRRGLRTLGRRHEAADTLGSLAAAWHAGFRNVSLDFIYAWPGQTPEQWRRDLEQILTGAEGGISPQHLSLYSLIVEPGTPIADAVTRGIFTPVDDDSVADFADIAQEILQQAGWLHYEIANWAQEPAYVSRHNAIYWRNGDYAGIGAGAHGHVGQRRIMNQPSPQRYIAMLADANSPHTNVEEIDAETAIEETIMLGLRLLATGIDRTAFARRHGVTLDERFAAPIARLQSQGLLIDDGAGIRLTERGGMLANAVAAEFMTG